jgi:hypothetical protein
MTPSPAAPAWAVELTLEVCTEAGIAPPDRLVWRRRSGDVSTGTTRHGDRTVVVRAGTDALDQRVTLLHELAHWLTPTRRRQSRRTAHHGRDFYRTALALYSRHGVSEADALRLESARYVSVLRHAVTLGIDGASSALAARRAEQRARPRRRWRVLVPEHPVRLEREGRWTVCSTCRQRVVGSHLARIRRARRPVRHVLLTRAP